MKKLDRAELDEVIRNGSDWVLVDRAELDGERPSMLHHASCKWLKKVGPQTRLRVAPDLGTAQQWLTQNYGDERTDWKQCNTCRNPTNRESSPLNHGSEALESEIEEIEAHSPPREVPYATGDQVILDWDADYGFMAKPRGRAALGSFRRALGTGGFTHSGCGGDDRRRRSLW